MFLILFPGANVEPCNVSEDIHLLPLSTNVMVSL